MLPDADIIREPSPLGEVFRTDRNDPACATRPDKIGLDSDGKPDGCAIPLSVAGAVNASYVQQ